MIDNTSTNDAVELTPHTTSQIECVLDTVLEQHEKRVTSTTIHQYSLLQLFN